jgi:hypothetical protein
MCDETLKKTLVDFEKLFSRDVEQLQTTVFKFNVSDGDEETVELQKKFLHLWLQLLDQEIMKI